MHAPRYHARYGAGVVMHEINRISSKKPLDGPSWPKEAPRCFQDAPRGFQEAPRWPQEAPRVHLHAHALERTSRHGIVWCLLCTSRTPYLNHASLSLCSQQCKAAWEPASVTSAPLPLKWFKTWGSRRPGGKRAEGGGPWWIGKVGIHLKRATYAASHLHAHALEHTRRHGIVWRLSSVRHTLLT